MLENYFKILDKYRSKVTDYVGINITEEKQKELGDVIPVFWGGHFWMLYCFC